jgi:outer membrane protein OmpA-like peptidoglycan-associated protein
VNVALKKGGLAKVASSADFGNQMAAVIIGNRDFDAKHPQLVEGLLKAAFAGGDQVRASDDALKFAAGVSAKVYNEQNAAYWAKYFKGVVERDKQGRDISLGGSRVMNAADNAYYFGLSGGEDVYKLVYDTFGQHYVKYYPSVMPSYPKYESVVNLSYLRSIIADSGVTAAEAEDRPVFEKGQKIERVVSRGNFTIEFDTGRATVRPESEPALRELLGQLASTTLAVEIKGHTDSVGNPQSNIVLSFARAEAVKKYLMEKAPQSFDTNRVQTSGLGQSAPIADNSTADGRAKNRRVEIILGSVGN